MLHASPQQPVSQARKDTAETHFTEEPLEAQKRQGLSMVLWVESELPLSSLSSNQLGSETGRHHSVSMCLPGAGLGAGAEF